MRGLELLFGADKVDRVLVDGGHELLEDPLLRVEEEGGRRRRPGREAVAGELANGTVRVELVPIDKRKLKFRTP